MSSRRNFLKGLMGSAAVVAAPSIAFSNNERLPILKSGLYSSDDIDEWETKITELIRVFSNRVNVAWNSKDVSKLPISMFNTACNEIHKIAYYTQREEDFPISDNVLDDGYISLIKYQLLEGEYRPSRTTLNMWKGIYRTAKDECMQNTDEQLHDLFTKFNEMYVSFAKEVNLDHKIKKLDTI